MVSFIERRWIDYDVEQALDAVSEQAEDFPVSAPPLEEGIYAMDDGQFKALNDFLKKKLGDKITCPICGSGDIRPGAILAPSVDRNQGMTVGGGGWRLPGNRAELFCHNCTYSMLFDPALIPGFPMKGRDDA